MDNRGWWGETEGLSFRGDSSRSDWRAACTCAYGPDPFTALKPDPEMRRQMCFLN
jgi:hypothetical protein